MLSVGAQGEGGLTNEFGPAAAGDVGEEKEGFPEIGGAVIQRFGDGGYGAGDCLLMIEDETGALATEFGGDGGEMPEAVGFFGPGFALHVDDDAAVGEDFGEAANAGDGFGAPGGKEQSGGAVESG